MSKWDPDKEFIEFLEWVERRDGQSAITLSGTRMIGEMKQGTPYGKTAYEHFYNDSALQEAYQNWEKTLQKGPLIGPFLFPYFLVDS